MITSANTSNPIAVGNGITLSYRDNKKVVENYLLSQKKKRTKKEKLLKECLNIFDNIYRRERNQLKRSQDSVARYGERREMLVGADPTQLKDLLMFHKHYEEDDTRFLREVDML